MFANSGRCCNNCAALTFLMVDHSVDVAFEVHVARNLCTGFTAIC
jgi:hypothetical protein